MSIIEDLKLSDEDVEKIVLLFCKAAVKSKLQERKVPVTIDDNAPLAAKILAFIKAQPDKQCKRYEISHQFKHQTQIRRLAALEELLKTGEIKTRTIKGKNGRKAVVYFVDD